MKNEMRTGDGEKIRRGEWIEDAAGNIYEIMTIKNSMEDERLAIAIEILLDDPEKPSAYRYGDMAATLTQPELYSCEKYTIKAPCRLSA